MTHARRRLLWAATSAAALIILWVVISGLSRRSRNAGPPRPSGSAAPTRVEARERAAIADPSLRPRASISGQVRDPGGKPLAGARVCGYASSPRLVSAEVREPTCAAAEGDGRYHLGGLLAPASYRFQAAAPGHVPGAYRDPELDGFLSLRSGEQRSGIDVVLQPGGVEVRGHVKDLSGGVIAGAFVKISSGTSWWAWGPSTVARSNDHGEFAAWVAPGGLRVRASADGYAPGDAIATAPARDVTLYLTPESVLVGRVVEAGTARGVAGAIVDAGDEDEGSGEGDTARTDAEGRFRIDQLSPGRYKPTALGTGLWGMAGESLLLGFGQTSAEVTIEVHRALEVRGFLVDAETRAGCSQGHVELEDGRGHDEWAETDGDGGVWFPAVLPGRYHVAVWCAGYIEGDAYPALEVRDAPLAGLVWQVRRGLAIRGRVIDGFGQGIPGAMVNAGRRQAGPRDRETWVGGETRDDGGFAVRGLVPGVYALEVEAPNRPPLDEPLTVVVDEADRSGVTIALARPTGTIEGVVVEEGGQPVAGAMVYASGDHPHGRRPWNRTGEDGAFEMKGMPAGAYRLSAGLGAEVLRAPGTTDDDLQDWRVEVVAGKAARIRLVVEARRREIRGRVVDERGRPVSDAFVQAQREPDSLAAQEGSAARDMRWGWGDGKPILTDVDGRFVIGKLIRGSYSVRAYRKGGGEALREKVPAGAAVTLTIADTGTIRGMVASGGPEEITIAVSDPRQGFQREERFFHTAGRFTMSGLPAGRYDVSAAAANGTALAEVVLAQGEERDGVVLELRAPAKVIGQVVSLEDGRPLPAMQLFVSPTRGTFNVSAPAEERKDVTDEDGRFEIAEAPAGKVSIEVTAVGWDDSEYGDYQTAVTLAPGRLTELPPLRVARRRTGPNDKAGDLGFDTREEAPDAAPDEITWQVARIRPAGPAEKSGLQVGDVISSVDGHDVTGANASLYETLSGVAPGATISLGLLRGATVAVTAGPPR